MPSTGSSPTPSRCTSTAPTAASSSTPGPRSWGAGCASSTAPAPARRPNPSAAKKIRIEVGRLEEEVSKLETKQNELTAALEAPETYTEPGKAQHLNRELSVVVDQLGAATAAWEKAAGELAELERQPQAG